MNYYELLIRRSRKSEPPPVIPTDYVRRYLLDGNLKDSKHLDNSDYDLTKPSGTTLSYATILGHMCTKISNGCVYNQKGTGMGITNGGALSIWTSMVSNQPTTNGVFKCFSNLGSGSAPFAIGFRLGKYAIAYTPSGGNAIISESSVGVNKSWWRMLTLNYDATNKKVQLWVDDKLEVEANLTTTLTKGSEIVVNGQNATNGTPDGMPDVPFRYRSLTFFNRTLSPQEIKGLYVEYNQGGGGGESTFSFPDSFSVTSCSYNGAAVGQYTKTSEKTTVNGVDYPVYSRYYDLLGTTFYIFVCDKFNGTSGAYWALNGDSEYSSTMDGNNTLGAVSVGSDGLPSSTTWTSTNGTSTVSWS